MQSERHECGLRAGLVLLVGATLLAAPAATAQDGETDLALLAQKSNNPLSDVWMLITQNDTRL